MKLKTQIVIKLKISNWDETQKHKWIWNSKTEMVTKLKESNCDKILKLKLWQNWTTQIVTKLEFRQISIYEKNTLKWSFSKNILTPWQLMRYSLGRFSQFSQCLWGTDDKVYQNPLQNWHYPPWSVMIPLENNCQGYDKL